jgi:hypothetical protein
MLTTKECEAVVPGTKPIKLFDGLGLYLHVTTGGHKGWRWKYRFGGKERGLVFGSFPEISLKRARDMRDDARALLRQGVDPGDERRARRCGGLPGWMRTAPFRSWPNAGTRCRLRSGRSGMPATSSPV